MSTRGASTDCWGWSSHVGAVDARFRGMPAADRRGARERHYRNGAATTRHHHERRHRAHGHEPAPDPLDRARSASRAASRCSNGDRVMPDPILVGRNAEKLAALAKAHGIDALDHRPRRRAARTTRTRCSSTPPRRSCAPSCCRRRSRPASTSIARSRSPRHAQGRARPRARREEGRHQARRGAGQAVPARPAQAQDADRRRLLRPHPLGARRVRLLGVRGRLAAGAAAVVELPQEAMAAASSSTCSATGATCSTTCSAR